MRKRPLDLLLLTNIAEFFSRMHQQFSEEKNEERLLSHCLKIAKKVAFKIASEASYVYILSGQKFIKEAENDQFWRFFENVVKQCYQIGRF